MIAMETKNAAAGEANRRGVAHCQAGEIDLGVACFREAVKRAPDIAEYRLNLGRALNQLGSWGAAEKVLAEAHALAPGDAAIHAAIARSYAGLKRTDELITRYRQAIAARPEDAVLKRNAASVLLQLGRADEAVPLAHAARDLLPKDEEAGLILATCLSATGQLEESEQALMILLAGAPFNAQAGFQLGIVRSRRGNYEAAAATFEMVVRIAPDHVDAMHRLAGMRLNMGQVTDAISLLTRVLAQRPNWAEAQRDLATALAHRGSIKEAAEHYRSDLTRQPDDREMLSEYAFILSLLPSAARREIFDAHAEWGRRHGAFSAPEYKNAPKPEKRLKIGYVSPDFREHSVSYFFEPLLAARDRGAFEIFCYAAGSASDTTTERLRKLSDHWRTLGNSSDDDVFFLVRKDGIDILVDLAGHTALSRLRLFARAPAPVQISWLGYPETTGVPAIGSKITDAVVSPPGAEAYATETLIRMPKGFHCYRPPADCPEIAPPPCLDSGYVTFGSFSGPPKMNPDLIGTWANVLHAVPKSRLTMKARQFADEAVRDKYAAMFGAAGIAPERLTFLEFSPTNSAHLSQYASIDICLDTHPYSGTTTICEALWMGVPVVTLMGERPASRVGGSLLSEIGMPELIAKTADEFVAIASKFAHDIPRLRELRASMRKRLEKTPLRDEQGFAREMESVYRDLWRRWCARN
jgi:predicted O-linked N-acetylglucosamine transferase (SPINDLY family)